MSKNSPHLQRKQRDVLPGIVYILAFLSGLLLFLLLGEPWLGIKPEPVWIALLMGLSVAAIMFWVWDEIHNQGNDHDN